MKLSKRPAICSATLGLVCLGAGPVPGRVMLEYQAPEGCPDEAIFRERVSDLYDFRDPFSQAGEGARHTVRIQIERTGGGYRGVIRTSGGEMEGRFSLPETKQSCETLVYLLAHRVRMIIAESSPAPPRGAAPSAEGPDVAQSTSREVDALRESVESQANLTRSLLDENRNLRARITTLETKLQIKRRNMDFTYSVFAGALMHANLTSDVGPGLWAGADLRFNPISVGVEIRGVLPSRFEIGDRDRDISHFVGLVTPCGRYFWFYGCVVAGAGVEFNHDQEVVDLKYRTQFGPLVQLGGRLGMEVPLGETRFAIRGFGEVLYSTPGATYSYTPGPSADRQDVSAFFGLGLVVKLGNWEGVK